MIKIELPIYYKTKTKTYLVGLNEYRNLHFQILNKIKKYYHQLIIQKLKDCKIEKIQFKKVHLSYKIYLKRGGTDGGNVRSVIEKFYLDAIKDYGLIENDTFEFVISDNAEYFKDKLNPRAEIEVKKVLQVKV